MEFVGVARGEAGVAKARRDGPDANGPKYRARRDQILDIAVASFRRRGYAGTSTQDISRALHMTKGSLYYYFRDKEDILFGCHERALDHLLSIARAVRRAEPDPEAALREVIVKHVGIMVHAFRGTALALEVGHLTGARYQRVVSRRDQYEGILRDILDEGVRSGAFRPMDTKLAAFAMLGAINWMARWYRDGGGMNPEDIGRGFADLFVGGLRPGRGGKRRVRAGSGRKKPRGE